MLPLKHLIICKETTIHIVPFTKEPQGKIKSHCRASQRDLCQHQVVGSMRQVSGVTPGTACAATVTIKKMLLLREGPVTFGVWCQGAEKGAMWSWKALQGFLMNIFCAPPPTWMIVLSWLLCSWVQVLPSGYLLACICLFCIHLSVWKGATQYQWSYWDFSVWLSWSLLEFYQWSNLITLFQIQF